MQPLHAVILFWLLLPLRWDLSSFRKADFLWCQTQPPIAWKSVDICWQHCRQRGVGNHDAYHLKKKKKKKPLGLESSHQSIKRHEMVFMHACFIRVTPCQLEFKPTSVDWLVGMCFFLLCLIPSSYHNAWLQLIRCISHCQVGMPIDLHIIHLSNWIQWLPIRSDFKFYVDSIYSHCYFIAYNY